MTAELRGKSAIVGTGHAGFGEAHGLTAYDVMAQSALAALGDAGLNLSDVDGLFLHHDGRQHAGAYGG